MVSVVWFQDDLRVHDHVALAQAAMKNLPIIGVYANAFSHPRYQKNSSSIKESFKRASLHDLAFSLEKYQIPLLYVEKPAHEVMDIIDDTWGIDQIYAHYMQGPFERYEAVQIKKKYPLNLYETQTLLHPSDLPFDVARTPNGYTSFRKKVEKLWLIRDEITPDLKPQAPIEHRHLIPEPSVMDFFLEPGETGGLRRLNYYTFESKKASTYKKTRNGMRKRDDSTKFSAYLACGALSPRRVYHTVKAYEAAHGASEDTYWIIFELLWRDYFKFQARKHLKTFFHKDGIQQKKIAWIKDDARLKAITTGTTGYPLIDANVKELLATGFMSNRGRQNVASFWTKNLGLDWRMGEAFFETHLIDYDVESNTGNWQYVTGIGNDSMPFRYFDVIGQGERYDPDESYVLAWLPELKKVPKGMRYALPKMAPAERQQMNLDYPDPIVSFYPSLDVMKKRYGV